MEMSMDGNYLSRRENLPRKEDEQKSKISVAILPKGGEQGRELSQVLRLEHQEHPSGKPR
jgi:hypothetical protein